MSIALFPRGPEADARLPARYHGLGVDEDRLKEIRRAGTLRISTPIEPYFGAHVTLDFGDRYYACPAPTDEHTGIDFAGGAIAQARVISPFARAEVVSAHYHRSYGHAVFLLLHDPEPAENIFARFFHLGSRKVRKGDFVDRGDLIAIGTTRPFAHVHFEVLFGRRDKPYWPWAFNPRVFADKSWRY
jgi:murein DD-endopeptidase MepM/ murein hydrolase activator NlpD